MRNLSRGITVGMAVLVLLLVVGCNSGVKQENEQLKSQVGSLQQENTTLKGQVTSLKADSDALKKQLDDVTKEKQDLEEKVKAAEAKASVKPGTKPPLKPKKAS